jgi:hypothetical protein
MGVLSNLKLLLYKTMGLGLSQSLRPDLRQEFTFGNSGPANVYYRAALKAFKKFIYDNKVFYTCNVERLKACNRLGSAKEVSLWKTHFFLCSPHFDECCGVVFSARPGEELGLLSQRHLEFLFLATGTMNMVNVKNGYRVELAEPLVFASSETNPTGL